MFVTGRRATAWSAALVATVLLAACQGDGDAEEPLPSPVSASATPLEATEAAAVLEEFWAERVRVESSGDYDTADFTGILDPRMIEPQLQQYQQLEQTGFRRIGAPQLRDFTARVEGDTAIATVCVQEDEWGAKADVKIEEAEPQGWYASSHRLVRTDGAWLIVENAKTPKDISC